MTDPLPPLLPPLLRVMWVDNHDDPRSTVKYLHDLAAYRRLADRDQDYGRIVVRPTPGTGGTHASVAIDLLTAIGKNPDVLRDERLTAHAWDLARAWLVGFRITDVVVDRAHELPTDRLVDLAEVATDVDATLWLVWSTLDTEGVHLAVKTLTVAGHPVKRTRPAMMEVSLPRPGPWYEASSIATPPQPQWPTLPTADFTTFRVAARRHLSPRAFARVDDLYQDAAARTDRWIAEHRDRYDLLPPLLVDIGPALVAWLRDEQLGAAPDPATALITLRAIQATLFLLGILLRWTHRMPSARTRPLDCSATSRPASRGRSPPWAAPTTLPRPSCHCTLTSHRFTSPASAVATSPTTPPACRAHQAIGARRHRARTRGHMRAMAASAKCPAKPRSACPPMSVRSSPRTWRTGAVKAPTTTTRCSSTPPSSASRPAAASAKESSVQAAGSTSTRRGCTAATASTAPISASNPAPKAG